MSIVEFTDAVRNINVFARLTPHMKLKIAAQLQSDGNIIAMTGDGVNDAPALKKADIGISMGIIGTDVARNSSEIVLADDNFATIISAIEEGRIVFNNVKQCSFFIITTSIAEQITILSTMLLNFPLPLLPTQILWLNLVTDTIPGLGLAVEPGHDSIEDERPKNHKENILNKKVVPLIFIMSFVMIVLTCSIFYYFLPQGLNKARTAAFCVMVMTQLYNSINMRSLNKKISDIGLFSNKYLTFGLILSMILLIGVIYIPFSQKIFQFQALSIYEFIALFLLSSIILIFGETYKIIKIRKDF